jgi:hypothetical protein
MNKNVFAGLIKTVFLYGVIGFMGYMTWHAVYNAMGDPWVSWLSLFLFDGGAYSGYKMLTGDAGGQHQRTAAKIILWCDFLLAAAMVAGALDILPTQTIRVVMLLSAGFNGWALYYYETHTPEYMEQAQDQDESDELTEAARRNRKKLHREAVRQADANISRQAIQLGNLLSLRATSMLKYEMRLPMTDAERNAFEGEVIDAETLPAPADVPPTAGQVAGLWEAVQTFFTGRRRNTRRATPSTLDASQPSEPSAEDPKV